MAELPDKSRVIHGQQRHMRDGEVPCDERLQCIVRAVQALTDEETRLEAREDICALVGQIIVLPEENGDPELLLKGDLAGILSLAAGKKTPAHPEDERVLLAMVAGAGFEPATFRL